METALPIDWLWGAVAKRDIPYELPLQFPLLAVILV
jgi:hypothetical protein